MTDAPVVSSTVSSPEIALPRTGFGYSTEATYYLLLALLVREPTAPDPGSSGPR